jgi:hypothetical protein
MEPAIPDDPGQYLIDPDAVDEVDGLGSRWAI